MAYISRDIRWICHTAIVDGPRSWRHAGLQTLIWTSYQPASQPMLPSITPNKELCSSPVDGRQEDSIVNSFVISRVDYCNSLLAGVPRYQLDRLQSVINTAARLIVGTKKHDHIKHQSCCERDRLHSDPLLVATSLSPPL